MMLDASEIRVCHASELQQGDFAFLDMWPNHPCYVSHIGDSLTAVRLDPETLGTAFWNVANLMQTAVVLRDVCIKVDPSSISCENPGPGALLRIGTKLVLPIRAQGYPNRLHLDLVTGLDDVDHDRAAFFDHWSITRMERDEEKMIFERFPKPKQAAQ